MPCIRSKFSQKLKVQINDSTVPTPFHRKLNSGLLEFSYI